MNPTGQFIEEIELKEEHVGKCVVYIPRHGRMSDPTDANGRAYDPHGPSMSDYVVMNRNHKDAEKGFIKSWNDGGVFVDYGRNTVHTDFSDLVWS